ncbi:MAG: HD-GYP domain-containing protein [Candidatus Omnitrophica bacterium]|nr:HD-GYP domain-containing protein [Candidatus Omnitrophota bacterium]
MSKEKYRSASHGFKITVVILLSCLTMLRLLLLQYFPSSEIIPDKFFLFIILAILFYLWLQEMFDFHKLVSMNKDLRLTQEHLKSAEIDTIGALIKTEEAKDLYTRGHSERVTKIALAIAKELSLTDDKKNIVNRAGILHDIGKIGLSDAILNKKEKLTDEEFEMIKKHPENAAAILEPLKFLATEKEVIVQHHERYDGKGYPKGLKAKEISFEAMIISVADAFDAMNSRRAYREALDRETIISELKKSRGTQHSPQVVDTFLKMLEKNPELWEK